MKWVVSLYLKHPLGDLLSLWNFCKAQNFLVSRAISSSGMLSYFSSEAAVKEDVRRYVIEVVMYVSSRVCLKFSIVMQWFINLFVMINM
jgi:hypothetical protein